MDARKLLLTALLGGPIAGAALGAAVDTTMKPPEVPSWRHSGHAVAAPAEAYYLAEAPPEDLSPYRLPPGYGALLARRAAAREAYIARLSEAEAQPAAYEAGLAGADATGQAGLEAAGHPAVTEHAIATPPDAAPEAAPMAEEPVPIVL